jgi:hypothetical protein
MQNLRELLINKRSISIPSNGVMILEKNTLFRIKQKKRKGA